MNWSVDLATMFFKPEHFSAFLNKLNDSISIKADKHISANGTLPSLAG